MQLKNSKIQTKMKLQGKIFKEKLFIFILDQNVEVIVT